MFRRIFFFLITNLLVILTISITLNALGIRPYLSAYGIDYTSLLVFAFAWGFIGAFISLALSRVMAKWMMKVRVITENTTNPQERALLNMVTNLTQNAGLPLPEVGIYPNREVNAFATGPTKKRSLVAVSQGLLERMDANELQGVLAHEVAHIKNGDMVTMTLIQGIINAMVIFFSRAIAWAVAQRLSDDDNPSFGLQFIITIVLEIALSLLGWLVVAYFSRAREFRADAGGAQYGGRSNMIAALRKLQQTHTLIDTRQESLATLKISDKPKRVSLWSTHPPLEERIKRLETSV
jgi:heat shock protein HtpX